VDIKKLGNIPVGGGHKVHGRAQGSPNSTRSTPVANNGTGRRSKLGYSYLHNAVDDHSRLAYTEILPDETQQGVRTTGPSSGVVPGDVPRRGCVPDGTDALSRAGRDPLSSRPARGNFDLIAAPAIASPSRRRPDAGGPRPRPSPPAP
jgi:hypothetical protein